MKVLVVVAALFLAACAPEGGTVTDSFRNADGKNWTVCASKDGEDGCNTLLSVSDGPRCSVGEVYPQCLKGRKRR
jgi:putative hemolysin